MARRYADLPRRKIRLDSGLPRTGRRVAPLPTSPALPMRVGIDQTGQSIILMVFAHFYDVGNRGACHSTTQGSSAAQARDLKESSRRDLIRQGFCSSSRKRYCDRIKSLAQHHTEIARKQAVRERKTRLNAWW